MRLSLEQARKVAAEFQPAADRLDVAMFSVLAELVPLAKNEKAIEYLKQGVGRRIKTARRCLENVFKIFPPERTRLLEIEELNDIQINLHAFAINVYGILDNIAWVYMLEQGRVSTTAGDRTFVGLFNKRTQQHLSEPLRSYLNSKLLSWFEEYAKNYRDALAHRIPLYVPPYTVRTKDSAKWQDLGSAIQLAMTNRDIAEVIRLRAEQDSLGTICGAFSHLLSDDARPLFLHPQMICDALSVSELIEKVVEDVKRSGWGARADTKAS
ncbi:MAG TPA: hypothetical protein VHE58_04580 [Burkholderiales bacterium]|nr:hypothetical protein [Burkholderiales bacterium]